MHGHVEGAEQQGERCLVSFRGVDAKTVATESVALPGDAIIDGGSDRFVEANRERLVSGDVFKRPFLVPSFHRFVDFRIYLEEEREADVVFIMESASFWVRLVGERIRVTYDRDDASLKRYEGIPNIRDESGENCGVRVEFRPGGLDEGGEPANP